MYETIPEYLSHLSEKYPNRTALYIRRFLRTTKFTYLGLHYYSRKIAMYLLEAGIERGDCVLIWAPNMPEWVLAWLGALTAGIVAVPVGLHSTSDVVEKYIDQTKPKALFVSKFYPIDLHKAEHKNLRIINLEEIVELAEKATVRELPRVPKTELAEIVFTSGTTGEPKGVMISHYNILYQIEQLIRTIPHYKHFRMLSILPLSHVMEQVVGLFGPMLRGATIFYLPGINSVTIKEALRKYRITDLGVVPQMLRMFLDTIEFETDQQKKTKIFQFMLGISRGLPMFLRRILFSQIHESLGKKLFVFGVGSAPLDINLAQDWEAIGIKVVEGYGASELTGGVTANRIDNRKLGSVGRKLPGMELRIATNGEIQVRGDNVFRGYFKNDEKTRNAFTTDRFFRTGDVGHFDKDGWLYITGREKFKIVTAAGDKIYPEDVERKLNAHPAIWDSCVMGIKKNDGEIVYASIILREKTTAKIDEVVKEVNTTLEPNQQILEFSLWPDRDFPRLHTLKVDRNTVKAQIEGGQNNATTKDAEKGKGDELTEIISKVCKVSKLKVKETSKLVSDFGLDSLKRVELVSLLENEFGLEVDEELIKSGTTVAELRLMLRNHTVTTFPYDLEKIAHGLRNPVRRWFKVFLQDIFIIPFYNIFINIRPKKDTGLSKLHTPIVFVGNHPSTHDGVALFSALPARIRSKLIVLADDIHWRAEGIGRNGNILELLAGCFPINKRGSAIRKPMEIITDFLDDGYNLLILPEGKYTPGGEIMAPLHKGTEILLEDSDTTIVPFFISMKTRSVFQIKKNLIARWMPHGKLDRATIHIGQPFTLKDKTGEAALAEIRKRILDLYTDE